MLDRKKADAMAAAIQRSVAQSLETHRGECIAYDEDSGEEYSHKWRGGETRVFHEDVHTDQMDGTCCDYVFRVRVELVAVLDS